MQVRPRDGSCALHQRRDRTDGLKFHRAADEGASMNTTRYRTLRSLTGAIISVVKVNPTKALAAHTNLEDLRPLRTPAELAHLYAATYTDHSEGEPIR